MYPVCLEITDKLCVVVGGGIVAERKVLGLLTAEARVRVISPRLTSELLTLADKGRVEWLNRGYRPGDLIGALLVFAATDNPDVQAAVVEEATASGQMVNVIDAPDICTFQVPAVVRQGDLTLAVSTGGKSPAVAAMIRQQLEQSYGEEYKLLLNLVAGLREQVLEDDRDNAERKILFQKILHDDIITWIKDGRWEKLRSHLRTIFGPDMDLDISQEGSDK